MDNLNPMDTHNLMTSRSGGLRHLIQYWMLAYFTQPKALLPSDFLHMSQHLSFLEKIMLPTTLSNSTYPTIPHPFVTSQNHRNLCRFDGFLAAEPNGKRKVPPLLKKSDPSSGIPVMLAREKSVTKLQIVNVKAFFAESLSSSNKYEL